MNISLSRCVVGYNPKIPNGSPWGKVQAENEKPETVHQGWARCANVINLTYFQDSHIVRLVCDETEQDEELMKELERGEDGHQQFFLADPGCFKFKVKTIFSNRLFNSFGHCYCGQTSIWVGSRIKKLQDYSSY